MSASAKTAANDSTANPGFEHTDTFRRDPAILRDTLLPKLLSGELSVMGTELLK